MGKHSSTTPGTEKSDADSSGGSTPDTEVLNAPRTPTPSTFGTLPRKALAFALVIAAIFTVVGLIMHGRHDSPPRTSEAFHQHSGMTGDLITGTVSHLRTGACNSPQLGQTFDTIPPVQEPQAPTPPTQQCTQAIVLITSGKDTGQHTLLEVNSSVPGSPKIDAQDKILLSQHGAYAFQDYQRTSSVVLWLILAVVLICAVGAWRGVRSIVGLVITFAVVALFLIPGITHGGNAVLLALLAGSTVLFSVLFLVHGWSWKTASALGGSLMAFGMASVLSYLALIGSHVRGLGDEDNLNILLYLPGLDIGGLMLAGMIIGSLGILNDVTIAQASTVTELHSADPGASRWSLFRGAMRVGRDHIASMVYTLVLGYTGMALPTLLLVSLSGRPFMQVLTSDVMATEVLRSVTGAIALVCAVPLTTGLAAATSAPRPHRHARGAVPHTHAH